MTFGYRTTGIAVPAAFWIITSAFSVAHGQDESGEDLASQLPRLAARSPQEALESFQLDPELVIELVASEPDVIDPVVLKFDARGRLFVVEMRDYPFTSEKNNLTTSPEAAQQPDGRVRLLEDRDGDGRIDSSRVFADELAWPTGLAIWKDGVFVTAAPDILYLADRDDDGHAEERRVVWTGFGRRNVQALVNGLTWSIDNSIYGASGYNGGNIRPGPQRGDFAPAAVRSRDFRFDPRGGPLALVPTGGQYGLCFDAAGRRFVCSNSNHLRHVVIDATAVNDPAWPASLRTVLDIAEDGGAAPVFRTSPAEPWRKVRTRWRASSPDRSRYPATELVPIGYFTSATGLVVYDGDALPESFRGDVIIGDVGGNLVHRKELFEKGTTFTARRPAAERRREFLTSTDNWFRPTFCTVGPDGALYICDMYRETIEHPYSIPASIKEHLRLTSGNDRGRIWRVRRRRDAADRDEPLLAELDGAALVGELRGANGWRRRTAQRLLIEKDRDDMAAQLEALAADDTSSVGRLHALWTLQGLGQLSEATLASALASQHATVRENALRIAARRENLPSSSLRDALAALGEDEAPRVRLELALALRDRPNELALPLLARLARQPFVDTRLDRVVLFAVGDAVGKFARELFETSSGQLELAARHAHTLGERAAVLGNGAWPFASDARAGPEAPGEPTAVRLRIARDFLVGFCDGLRKAGKSFGPLSREWERSGLFGVPSTELLPHALQTSLDRKAPSAERVAWIRLIASLDAPGRKEHLLGFVSARESRSIQIAAIRALSDVDAPNFVRELLDRWPSLSPRVRREVIAAIFERTQRIEALLGEIEDGRFPARQLDPGRVAQLKKHPDASVRALATGLLGRTDPDRKKVIDSYRPAIEAEGDERSGREVFVARCATCHRLGEVGSEVGPDLVTVRGRGADSILEQILDPNREVLPRYISYTAVTRDGRVIKGLLVAESSAEVTFLAADGRRETVLRESLVSLTGDGVSLMPEGLEADISVEQMRDLLTFLLSHEDTPEKP